MAQIEKTENKNDDKYKSKLYKILQTGISTGNNLCSQKRVNDITDNIRSTSINLLHLCVEIHIIEFTTNYNFT